MRAHPAGPLILAAMGLFRTRRAAHAGRATPAPRVGRTPRTTRAGHAPRTQRTATHTTRTPARAVVAALACVVLPLAGCMDTDPELRGEFAERSGEPTGIRMPDSRLNDMPGPTPQRESRGSQEPCAIDDVVLAACLPETTALASPAPGRGIVATADGVLWLVVPGMEPRPLTEPGSPVQQILPGPTSAEDGQVYVLRYDGSVARMTLLAGGDVDWRDLRADSRPGTQAIYFDRAGELNTLLAGDYGIDIISVCHAPNDGPPLMTVRLDGEPMLAQWSGGFVEPLGGVDLANSIGGCAFDGERVIVAVPDAHRVVGIPITAPLGESDSWSIDGSPDIILEGEYGRVGSIAVVLGEEGLEIWGATENKARGEQGAESDERVFRLPAGGSEGGSPD